MALTEIEVAIVQCLAQGMQSKEVATVVNRSKATVEGYVRLLYAKLNARSRAQLVLIAAKSGLIDDHFDKQGLAARFAQNETPRLQA